MMAWEQDSINIYEWIKREAAVNSKRKGISVQALRINQLLGP